MTPEDNMKGLNEILQSFRLYSPESEEKNNPRSIKDLAHDYQEKYRAEVLPALSKGCIKLRGWYHGDLEWYDPEEDKKLLLIDAMYDLFDRLKKGVKPNETGK